MRRRLDLARRADERTRRLRSTQAAQDARLRSRAAYQGLSRGEAWQLLDAKFAGQAGRLWSPLTLKDGETASDFIGAFRARIHLGGDQGTAMVESALPLRTTDHSGHNRLVDLTLSQRGNSFVPDNPLAPVTIAANAAEGLSLDGPGIGISSPDDDPGAGAVLEGDGHVFASDVATDTDQIVTPTPTGAEISWQVRSAASPEAMTLGLDLPPGATARLSALAPDPQGGAPPDGPRGVEIVKDGQVLAAMPPPLVQDSEGVDLPAWYELSGQNVVVRFPHHDADVEYPLIVDPVINDSYTASADFNSTAFFSGSALNGGQSSFSFARQWNGHVGLVVGAYQWATYNDGAWGEWAFTPPSGSYVYSAIPYVGYHNPDNSGMYTGLWASSTGWEVESPQTTGFTNNYSYDLEVPVTATSPPDNNLFVFGLMMNGTSQRLHGAQAGFDGLLLSLGDRNLPTFDTSADPSKSGRQPTFPSGQDNSKWTNATQQSVSFKAYDTGLGLFSAGVARRDGTAWNPNSTNLPGFWVSLVYKNNCNGSHGTPCPLAYDTSSFTGGWMPYDISGVPDGIRPFSAAVTQYADTTTPPASTADGGISYSHQWTEKIDRTAPLQPTLSGTLWNARDHWITSTTGILSIHATDATSGVAKVHITVTNPTNGHVDSSTDLTNGCMSDGCAQDATFNYTLPTDQSARTISVYSVDRAGNQGPSQSFQIAYDAAAPSDPTVSHVGPVNLWTDSTGSVSSTATSTDSGSGVHDFSGTAVGCVGTISSPCAHTGSSTSSYGIPSTEGINRYSIRAYDAAGRASVGSAEWAIKVDRTPPPAPTLDTSQLTPLVGSPLPLLGAHVICADATDGSTTSDAAQRSGVKQIEFSVDGVVKYADGPLPPVDSSSDHACFTYDTALFSSGSHTIKVRARDQLDHWSDYSQVTLISQQRSLGEVESMLGLEKYLPYRNFDTGAGSTAHVNLASGNLAWDLTPFDDPGRGLHTVFRMVYNSQEGGQGIPSVYSVAGTGFSPSLTGLTRLNEPLDLSLAVVGAALNHPEPVIGLTDTDGTRHVFVQHSGNSYFTPPHGVHLFLRAAGTITSPDPRGAWVITDPQGVSYFYNALGYPTGITDRNGDHMTLTYATGSCLPLPCRQVTKITDAAGVDDPSKSAARSMTLAYYPLTDLNGDAGKLADVTDRAGHVIHLDYDPLGNLTSIDEAPSATAPQAAHRVFGLSYEAGLSLPARLQAVTDPDGHAATEFSYSANDLLALGTAGGGDRVLSVTNRARKTWNLINYTRDANNTPGTNLDVVDPLGHSTHYHLDQSFRLDSRIDPLGTEMTIGWDGDNNPTSITRAANRGTQAETATREYNANGLLEAATDPAGDRTTYCYTNSSGHLGSPPPADSAAASQQPPVLFVSDLSSVTPPRGGNSINCSAAPGAFTTSYQRDTRGNVTEKDAPTESTDAHPRTWIFTRDPAQHYLLTAVKDPDPTDNTTTYSDFDDNGLPQTKVDARGKTWLYRYDAVGNQIKETEPNPYGTTPDLSETCQPFTTTVVYDGFDQATETYLPKDSSPTTAVCRHRSRTYDANGNVLTDVDGERNTTTFGYSALDQLGDRWAESAPHTVEDTTSRADPLPASREHSHYSYDDAGNLAAEQRPPKEALAAADGAYTTTFAYDAADRLISKTDQSRGATSADLTTSYAYDFRDNLTGEATPYNNHHDCPNSTPAANAASDACRRHRLAYDAADRLIDDYEDPSGLNQHTHFGYDDNGNQATVTDPNNKTTTRGFDHSDELTSIVDGAGAETDITPRWDGQPVSETSPNGTATAGAAHDFETDYTYYPTGEVKTRSIPRASGQYSGPTANTWEISYTRNDVGNPTSIEDGRGNPITNTFWDSGELKTTDRPSWWFYDSSVDPATGQEVGLRERTPDDPAANDSASGSLPQRGSQGDFADVAPAPMPQLLPKAGATSFTYYDTGLLHTATDVDGDVRTLDRDALGRVTDTVMPFDGATKITTSYGYDFDGNLTSQTDGEGNLTTHAYDQFDRLSHDIAPKSAASGTTTTTYGYDEDSNRTSVQRPIGLWQYKYDAVDQLHQVVDPLGDTTSYGHDPAGNLSDVTTPRGTASSTPGDYKTSYTYDGADHRLTQTDPLGNQTLYGYDGDGNLISDDQPGSKSSSDASSVQRRVTTYTYNGQDLPWVTTEGAGGSDRRTVTEYDPNEDLRRVVNPAGVSPITKLPSHDDAAQELVSSSDSAAYQATVYEYSADGILKATNLPYGDADSSDSQHFRADNHLTPRGNTDRAWAPQPTGGGIPSGTNRNDYTFYDNDWVASESDPVRTNGDQLTVEYHYDKNGQQTSWEWPNSISSNSDSAKTRYTKRYFWPSGQLEHRDAGTISTDSSNNRTYSVKRTYDYAYNDNNDLTNVTDSVPGQSSLDKTTALGYDAADQLLYVDNSDELDTVLTYDEDGNVHTRDTDATFTPQNGSMPASYAGSHRTTTFGYDPIDRQSSMAITGDSSPSSPTTWTYWPSGDVKTRTTPVGAVESRYFDDTGLLTHTDITGADGSSSIKNQTYTYDANANRASDEDGAYTYNSRSQLTNWTHPVSGQPTLAISYDLDGSGAPTSETLSQGGVDTTTTYSYDGDQLKSSTVNGTTTNYTYDAFGQLKTAGSTQYGYDEFERLRSESQDPLPPRTYCYDAFDRRSDTIDTTVANSDYDTTCQAGNAPAGSKIYHENFLALSDKLTSEDAQPTGSDTANHHYFAYDGQGQPESENQVTVSGGTPSNSFQPYALTANGSVQGLLSPNSYTGTYDYSPYGEQIDDASNTLTNSAGASAPLRENPLRFQGFYQDSTGTYNMGARSYRDDVANVGRFLTADRFESAAADYDLQQDPSSHNRYVFGGGDPVDSIENDGHDNWGADEQARGCFHCKASPRRVRAAAAVDHRIAVSQSQAAALPRPAVDALNNGVSVETTFAALDEIQAAGGTPVRISSYSYDYSKDQGGVTLHSTNCQYHGPHGEGGGCDTTMQRDRPGGGGLLLSLISQASEALGAAAASDPYTAGLAGPLEDFAAATDETVDAVGVGAAKAGTEVAEEVATKQVTVLGRYVGGTEHYIGEPGFNVLNVPGKGAGRWNWTRNKRFIDDAIERGDEIRLVTNPYKPLYSGGNTYQRELKYLNKRGYGRFEQSGDYWVAGPGR